MKRWISSLLIMMLALGTFGCSPAEVGLIALNQEVNAMEAYTFEFVMEMNTQRQRVENGMLVKEANVQGSIVTGEMDAISGDNAVKVSYQFSDKEKQPPAVNAVTKDGLLYVPTAEVVRGMAISDEEWEKSDQLEAKLETYIAQYPYLTTPVDVGADGISKMEQIMYFNNLMNTLTKSYEGYQTNWVGETKDGFTINITGESFIKEIEQLARYLENNPSAKNETRKVLRTVLYDSGFQDADEFLALFDEWMDELSEWEPDTWAEMDGMEFIKDTSLKGTITLSGEPGKRIFTTDLRLTIEMPESKSAMDMVVKMTIQEAAVTIDKPIGASMDRTVFQQEIDDFCVDFQSAVIQLENDKSMMLPQAFTFDKWMVTDPNYYTFHNAQINLSKMGKPFSWQAHIDLLVQDGVIWVEANDLKILLNNQKIIWKNDEKAFYLSNGDQYTAMSWMMDNNKCYLKLRDITKASYNVIWSKTPTSTVTITPMP